MSLMMQELKEEIRHNNSNTRTNNTTNNVNIQYNIQINNSKSKRDKLNLCLTDMIDMDTFIENYKNNSK